MELGPLSDDIDLTTGRARTCRHEAAEPVRLLLTDELVAWLCPACDAQLPAAFKVTDARVQAVLAGVMSPDEAREVLAARVQAVKERFGG